MSTDLHRRTIAFDYGDNERGDLMREVWAPTPWMIDVFTGNCGDGRERDILHWCYEEFGEQASPIHGRAGDWQRGGATINGWTWFGFATEALMARFVERWCGDQPTHPDRTKPDPSLGGDVIPNLLLPSVA
jgi:hypothetical protein